MGESPRATRLIVAAVLLAAALPGGSGCSNSTDSGATYAVAGRVRDADGNPVRNARVAIEYSLTDAGVRSADAEAPRPESCISFTLPEAADVKLWIADYNGHTVRMVIDGARPAGSYEECWDGTADNGDALPDGLYYHHLERGSTSLTKAFLLTEYCIGMARTDAYLALTNADGDYAIGWQTIPVGESVPEVDSEGNVIRNRTVSNSVRICAWKDQASGSESAEIRENHSATVDVVIQ